MLDNKTRLELVADSVRYCQRAKSLGMPVAGYAKTPREAIYFAWTLRLGSKAKAARYRSRAAVGLKWGDWEICLDHCIPFRYQLDALMKLTHVTPKTVLPVLKKFDVYAIITKTETDPLARYRAAGIKLLENAGFGRK